MEKRPRGGRGEAARPQACPRSLYLRALWAGEVRPIAHFAAFCASLTESEDRWEGQPLKLESWQKRFWREALDDWRSGRRLVEIR